MDTLPPNQRLAAPGKWPVVGEKAPRDDDAPWTVTVDTGASLHVFSLDTLRALPQEIRVIDIHCVTRWSKPAVAFTGFPLETLLARCTTHPFDSGFVRFIARSERRHDTSLSLDDARTLGVFIAFAAEGAPLEPIHGGPVRTVTPGRYFYKSLKWLERIELRADDRLGFWETSAGYHNHADPWHEERYIAPDADPKAVARALGARDVSGLDLRGLMAAGRDLTGLRAVGARLRDAHFEGAILYGADFSGANLSNAHLQNARLRGARLVGADLEGAAFDGADLNGADFTGASLFGTTFDGARGGPWTV
jgi:DMSO/TMAO reductase YedYZ molybdopterin-dependent catalytic subunit